MDKIIKKLVVREAKDEDATFLADVYNEEVINSDSNYESVAQSNAERLQWLQGLKKKNFPVLVAEQDGKLAGFGALTPFHSLTGYRHTATAQLYIAKEYRRLGIGKKISNELFREAKKREFHTVIAGVNSQNRASIKLLFSIGFKQVGHFKQIGNKNGKWHDDVCLQLML